MGYFLSSTVGVGLNIPKDKLDYDVYLQLETLLENHETLTFAVADYFETIQGAAIFVEIITKSSEHCVPISLPRIDFSLSTLEEQELREVAKELGIDYVPTIVSITNYS